jgi:dihydropteroate synthase
MFTLNCKGRILTIDQPIVMGIINVTPDSFFSGSRASLDEVLFKAENMIREGALILDIGGQSTRPNSERVPVDEELKRVLPAIEAVHSKFPEQLISVDSFYSQVAKESVLSGASIINDVSAGSIDPFMIETVASLDVPYVLMHMKGDPQTMQNKPEYHNVTLEIFDFLNFKMSEIIKAGINDIIIDPGFGFGKTLQNNFRILSELQFFNQLKRPLMVGLSRKATIYKTLEVTPADALNGSTVMHTIALLNGASILRVHDVKEAIQAIKLVKEYRAVENNSEV